VILAVFPNPSNHSLNDVTVNWSASDINLDEANVNVSYPNGSVLNIFYTNFTLSTSDLVIPGNYTIRLFANDTAGFSNESIEYLFVQDVIAPTVELIWPLDNGFNNTMRPLFYFNVTDISDISNCSLIIYGSVYNTTYNINRSANNSIGYNDDLGEASYPWSINCTDNSTNYNVGSSETWDLTIDLSEPDVGLNTPLNDSWTNNSLVQFNFTPTDDYLDACQLWGNFSGNWSYNQTIDIPTSGSINNFSLIELSDGSYIWNVWCNDSALNVNWAEGNYTVKIDLTNPGIEFESPTPDNNSNQSSTSVVINVSYNEWNKGEIKLYWNGSLNTTKQYIGEWTNFTLEGLWDGEYSYYVWLNDSAGNSNETETRIFRVDTTPPTIELIAPENDTWKNNASNPILFEFNVSDVLLGIANCSLVVNGDINMSNSTVREYENLNFSSYLDSGYYNWSVNCTDSVGNENFSLARHIKVDLTFPSMSQEGINGTNFTVNEFICLNITVADLFSDVKAVTATVDYPVSGLTDVIMSNSTNGCGDAGGNIWSYSLLNIEEGLYNWTLTTVEDNSGNVNATNPGLILNWSATINNELNVSMTAPSADIEINESEANYEYTQSCFVECIEGSCNDLYLYTQYNNGSWNYITNMTDQLVSSESNHSCGNLSVAEGTWWNSSWEKRRTINISNVRSESLIDFPVYLVIEHISSMDGNYTDLRFINGSCDESGTRELEYDIDNYNISNAAIWVKIPKLDSGVNQICMYYNNSNASGGEDETGVWSNGFISVWHFDGNSWDSAGNFNGTDTNIINSSGYIGDAYKFESTASAQVKTAFETDGYANLTWSMWINVETLE
jgi:hypothetical protein